MSDSRIKKLCENVYLVCGKLIGFDAPGMFDMEDPGIRKDFIAFADDLYTEESEIPDRRYGDETICIFAGLSVRIATEGLDARMTEEEVLQLSRLLGMVMKNLERLAEKYDVLLQENEPDFQPGPASGENSPEKPSGMVFGGGSPEKPPGMDSVGDSPEEAEEPEEISEAEENSLSRDGPS